MIKLEISVGIISWVPKLILIVLFKFTSIYKALEMY